MLLIQLTGLSGAGKTTIAYGVKERLIANSLAVEVVDGDEYRKNLCSDLGFSKNDRIENIRRLGAICQCFTEQGIVSILAAINPYECARQALKAEGDHVKIVWLKCDIDQLNERDQKDLYRRALLPTGTEQKIYNLSGINDPYEIPVTADLIIDTAKNDPDYNINTLYNFIIGFL